VRALSLVVPIRRSRRERGNYNNSPLTWFFAIAQQKADEYYDNIHEAGNDGLKKELARTVIDVSQLLRSRYRALIRAGLALRLSLITTTIAASVAICYPYIIDLIHLFR
jgi:hypothetical protein